MNLKKAKFEKLRCISNFLIAPIQDQAPFFIMWCLLMGSETIRTWNAVMCIPPGISVFSYLGRFSIIFFQAWTLAFIITRLKWRWLKTLCYLLLFTPFIITLYLLTDQHSFISPTALNLIFETDLRESGDFVNLYIFKTTGLKICFVAIFFIFFVFLLERYRAKAKTLLSKKFSIKALSLITPLTLLGSIASFYTYIDLFSRTNSDQLPGWQMENFIQPHDSYSQIIYSVYSLYLASEQTGVCIKNTKEAKTKKYKIIQEEKDSLFVVVVIGESFIRSHSSLYDYPLQTSPELTKERNSENLVVFNDVISPYSTTSATIRNILCTNSINDGEKWFNTPYFPAAFKQAGFNVQLWDNQLGGFDKNVAFSFALNSLLFDKEIEELSYNGTNPKSYKFDHELIEEFSKHEPIQSQRNLIFFHLNGQHADASTRYPHEPRFKRFTADSIRTDKPWIGKDERAKIAEYDNCTVYNDYVMSEIFNLYRERNAIVIYFSDHGGMMYEQPDMLDRKLNHDYSKEMLEPLFRIPFVIWMSDKFKSSHPEHYNAVFEARNKPFMIDNLCQILFHLTGLNNPWLKRERDLLSPAYNVKDRIIEEKVNFDSIVPKIAPMP